MVRVAVQGGDDVANASRQLGGGEEIAVGGATAVAPGGLHKFPAANSRHQFVALLNSC